MHRNMIYLMKPACIVLVNTQIYICTYVIFPSYYCLAYNTHIRDFFEQMPILANLGDSVSLYVTASIANN